MAENEKSDSAQCITCTKTAIWLIWKAQPELRGSIIPTAGN